MSEPNPFHADWSSRPLWWDDVPLKPTEADLPASADVVIVGSGYCGLSAARTLAGTGMRVVVLEAADPGYGASTRNHGMVAGGLKVPGDIDRRVGPERGRWIRESAKQSFIDFKAVIEGGNLDVDFAHGGRFTGAHTPAAFARQAKRGAYLHDTFGYTTRALPRAEQRSEIGSDFYYGGLLIEESAGIHPAKLYRELRRLAEEAGAIIVGRAEVRDIAGKQGAFTVRTAKGEIAAEQVMIATNAYTGAFNGTMSPYIRRRVVPVTAYMIATEELPDGLAAELLPTNRMCGDTKRSLFAFRLSPDRKRIVFAGRAKFRDIGEREATPILHRFMCSVFPQLEAVKVTHSWKGMVCFTFDDLPHMGVVDGVHYAAGCQGSGVVMMSYLGQQTALKIISGKTTQCGFDGLNFPARPLYQGDPWFLPGIGAYYKTRDAIERYIAARAA
jgi:glycine/D-amino acid oxidase-like deaminating enzyme